MTTMSIKHNNINHFNIYMDILFENILFHTYYYIIVQVHTKPLIFKFLFDIYLILDYILIQT